MGRLEIAGEDIEAGRTVVLHNGKAVAGLATREHDDAEYLGESVERIREGLRVYIKDGEVREDDA